MFMSFRPKKIKRIKTSIMIGKNFKNLEAFFYVVIRMFINKNNKKLKFYI